MYEFIKGKLIELTPTHVVFENNEIGYFVRISLQTYTKLEGKNVVKLFIESIIREDSYTLYGFFDKKERALFRLLISVSGVGASTANIMLSALDSDELKKSILTGNVEILKSIKGIGAKTAQRIIVDLKDKLGKDIEVDHMFTQFENETKDEALAALVMLGFSKNQTNKVIDNILRKEKKQLNVEELIKRALKML